MDIFCILITFTFMFIPKDHRQNVNIGSDNGLGPSRHHTITWTNDDTIHRICWSTGLSLVKVVACCYLISPYIFTQPVVSREPSKFQIRNDTKAFFNEVGHKEFFDIMLYIINVVKTPQYLKQYTVLIQQTGNYFSTVRSHNTTKLNSFLQSEIMYKKTLFWYHWVHA